MCLSRRCSRCRRDNLDCLWWMEEHHRVRCSPRPCPKRLLQRHQSTVLQARLPRRITCVDADPPRRRAAHGRRGGQARSTALRLRRNRRRSRRQHLLLSLQRRLMLCKLGRLMLRRVGVLASVAACSVVLGCIGMRRAKLRSAMLRSVCTCLVVRTVRGLVPLHLRLLKLA